MPDKEKVIKGVHDARKYLEDREWVDKSVGVHIDALNDALALLKEQQQQIWELQDQVEYLTDKQKTANLYKCPNCGTWVSAENVVRCKDCKHFEKADNDAFVYLHCNNLHNEVPNEDWFCAEGERKG